MSLTPIFHTEEDWLKAMVDKDKGSLVPRNREEEWYSEIIDSMQSGGGSGGGVLSVSVVTSGTELFRGTLPNVTGYEWRSTTVGNAENYYVDFACDLSSSTYNELSAVIGDVTIIPTDVTYSNGTVTLKVGTENTKSGVTLGYTSEEEISGKTLVLYADAEARLDKTWQEIKDAPMAIIEIEATELGQTTYTTYYKQQTGFEAGTFFAMFMELTDNEVITFIAPSASGYPTVAM